MKKTAPLLLIWTLLFIWTYMRPVKAQNSGVVTMWASASHSSCPVPVVGESLLCLASDGLYLSVNGGTLTPVSVGIGVVSVNGKTGVVNLTGITTVTAPPVSVSGETITVAAPSATTVIN